jgi:hypothetical protein
MKRMAQLASLIGILLAIAGWSRADSAPPISTLTTQCLGPDSNSAELIAYLQFLVTGSDTGTVAQRGMWGLPATSSGSVTLVTDSRTCAKAADAYSADITPASPMVGRNAYVIKVSTVYVVWDPNVKVGEWSAYRTMDSKFNVTARTAG